MRIEYERACRQAGLSEEKIREIRKVFDTDYKQMKREQKARIDAGFVNYSLEWLMNPGSEVCCFDAELGARQVIAEKYWRTTNVKIEGG